MVGRKLKPLVLSFCVILLFIGQTPIVRGISPGITVTPAQINLTLDQQDTEKSVPLVITNSYAVPISLVAEFQGIDENAGLLIPASDIDKNFAANLHISQTEINIAANSSLTVTLQVSNTASLSPGGHYATLVLTQQTTAGNQSAFKASLSLTIFVVKTDGAIQKLDLQNISSNGSLFKLPTTAVLSFSNVGNVHVVPRGLAEVTSRGDRLLAKGIVNENSIPLLPGKTFTSTVKLQPQQRSWLPQNVTLSVTYRADGSVDTQTTTRSFLYIPPLYIYILILIIIVAYLAVKKYKRVKKSTQKTAKQNYTSVRPSLHWDNPLKDKPKPSVKIQVKEVEDTQSKEAVRITLRPKAKPKPARNRAKKASAKPVTKPKKTSRPKTTNRPSTRKSSKTTRSTKTKKNISTP